MYIYVYICIYLYISIYMYGALSTLVTSVVLCSLTRATLMSPGQDETRVCGYIYTYIYYIHIYMYKYMFVYI